MVSALYTTGTLIARKDSQDIGRIIFAPSSRTENRQLDYNCHFILWLLICHLDLLTIYWTVYNITWMLSSVLWKTRHFHWEDSKIFSFYYFPPCLFDRFLSSLVAQLSNKTEHRLFHSSDVHAFYSHHNSFLGLLLDQLRCLCSPGCPR